MAGAKEDPEELEMAQALDGAIRIARDDTCPRITLEGRQSQKSVISVSLRTVETLASARYPC